MATVSKQDTGLDGRLVCPSMVILMFLYFSNRRGNGEQLNIFMLMQGNPIMAFIFPVHSTVTILKEIPNKIKGKITDFKNFAKKKKTLHLQGI